jgi:hypothetical protein
MAQSLLLWVGAAWQSLPKVLAWTPIAATLTVCRNGAFAEAGFIDLSQDQAIKI